MRATVGNEPRSEQTYTEIKPKHFWQPTTTERGPDRVVGYVVNVAVEFTEEERAILSQNSLWETPIFTKTIPPSKDSLRRAREFQRKFPGQTSIFGDPIDLAITVKIFAEGHGGDSFATMAEALNYEQKVKTEYLPQIKQLIDAGGSRVGKSETLEF